MAQTVKRLPAVRETQVRSLGWEDPLEKEMEHTPVFLPGESHRWRSLAGYSPVHGVAKSRTRPSGFISLPPVNSASLKSLQAGFLSPKSDICGNLS